MLLGRKRVNMRMSADTFDKRPKRAIVEDECQHIRQEDIDVMLSSSPRIRSLNEADSWMAEVRCGDEQWRECSSFDKKRMSWGWPTRGRGQSAAPSARCIHNDDEEWRGECSNALTTCPVHGRVKDEEGREACDGAGLSAVSCVKCIWFSPLEHIEFTRYLLPLPSVCIWGEWLRSQESVEGPQISPFRLADPRQPFFLNKNVACRHIVDHERTLRPSNRFKPARFMTLARGLAPRGMRVACQSFHTTPGQCEAGLPLQDEYGLDSSVKWPRTYKRLWSASGLPFPYAVIQALTEFYTS